MGRLHCRQHGAASAIQSAAAASLQCGLWQLHGLSAFRVLSSHKGTAKDLRARSHPRHQGSGLAWSTCLIPHNDARMVLEPLLLGLRFELTGKTLIFLT